MANTERLIKIDRMLRQRGGAGFEALRQALEVSRATLFRDLQFMKDRLGTPVTFDPDQQVYRIDGNDPEGRHVMPGMWFNEPELYAMLLAHQLLVSIDADAMLGRYLAPLAERIGALLANSGIAQQDLARRVVIHTPAKRPVNAEHFECVISALLSRNRIALDYFTRSRRASTQREISPQRLMHYRGTWYLDAWCHQAKDLRRFALDAIARAKLLETKAKEVSLNTVAKLMDAGYGIMATRSLHWATLIASADVAMWISHEQWHPMQQGSWLEDGSFELKLPYADPLELAMDVLRYHGKVRVASPPELRDRVRDMARTMADAFAA